MIFNNKRTETYIKMKQAALQRRLFELEIDVDILKKAKQPTACTQDTIEITIKQIEACESLLKDLPMRGT